MKKKFYDFSIATAIIVILAYVMVFILSIYTILDSESLSIGGIVTFPAGARQQNTAL